MHLTDSRSAGVALAVRNRGLLFWVAALLPFLALAFWRLTSGPGIDADDWAHYLMHAQALAEGRPYSDIPYVYSPYAHWIGPRLAMPGLPLLLSVAYRVVGPNIEIMRTLMLCFGVGFVVLAGAYFARHSERHLGIGVALLCGLSPAIVHASSQLLTDLPLAFTLWAVIVLMDLPGRLTPARLIGVTLLGAWAMLFRTAGLVLVPALLLFTVLRYKDHQLRPLIPVLAWSAGLLILSVVVDVRETSVLRFTPERILNWLTVTNFGLANIQAYLPSVMESQLHPFPNARANDVLHVLTSLLTAVGLIAWVRTSLTRFAVLFALVYAALLIIAPVHNTRYMWPLFPFFVFGLLNGVTILVRSILKLPMRARTVTVAFAVLLALGASRAVIAQPAPGDLLALPDVAEITTFMRNAADQHARASFFKPRSLAWATGIPTVGPLGGRSECGLEEMDRLRITHVIVGGIGRREAYGPLRRMVDARPDRFTLLLRNPTFSVYHLLPSTDPPRAPSATPCAPR
jgi:hypothetical protein